MRGSQGHQRRVKTSIRHCTPYHQRVKACPRGSQGAPGCKSSARGRRPGRVKGYIENISNISLSKSAPLRGRGHHPRRLKEVIQKFFFLTRNNKNCIAR